jgi:hypothetical protein
MGRSVGRKRGAKWRPNRNGKRSNKDDQEMARSARVTKMGSDERAGDDHCSLKVRVFRGIEKISTGCGFKSVLNYSP